MENDKPKRLTQYLDFVKLYEEVHKESSAKKEANKLWKEKIMQEGNENLSTIDYMEQLAVLKTKKRLQEVMEKNLDDSGVEFTCSGAEKSVKIAGTFNNWVPQSLDYFSDGDYWFKTLDIPPGTYTYKYVVDGEWMHDPSKECVDDGKGNINNVIRVDDKMTRKSKLVKEELDVLRKENDNAWFVEPVYYRMCPKWN